MPFDGGSNVQTLIDAIGIWNLKFGIYFKLSHSHIATFSN